MDIDRLGLEWGGFLVDHATLMGELSPELGKGSSPYTT